MRHNLSRFFTRLMVLLSLWFGLGNPQGISAQAVEIPTGPVILTVKGAISGPDGGTEIRYDRAMLEALGTTTIVTESPWTKGTSTFSGVLARDVMAHAGATGRQVKALALNNYSIEIPMTDFENYDVLLAMKRDGEYLTVRNRGPLWVVYPWSDQPKLRTALVFSRSIWQLSTLDVRPN